MENLTNIARSTFIPALDFYAGRYAGIKTITYINAPAMGVKRRIVGARIESHGR